MKARTCLPALALMMLASSGCIAWRTPVQPPRGLLYTHYRAPLTAETTELTVRSKVGTASTLYVGVPTMAALSVGWQTAAVEAAAGEGGLTQVDYADYEIMEILGAFGKLTVRAYGE